MPTSHGIELRHLRYFLAVYEELHFGRAAERLHMAQPPLSQAIRKLEQELGVELFARTSRAVEPTAAGTALAEEARRVLASFEYALTEARRVASGDTPLRIGVVSFLPLRRLERFLTELRRHDGSLRAEVTHMWALEQIERLKAGGLDLAVLVSPGDQAELESEPLFPGEEISAFVPTGHRLAGKSAIGPEDLDGETMLTFPRTVNPSMYDRYMAMFADAGYRFARLHEIDSRDPRDVLLAVSGGLGIGLGPMSLQELGVEARSVTRLRIEPALRLPDTVVAWRASAPRRLRSLLAAVRDAARTLHAEALAETA